MKRATLGILIYRHAAAAAIVAMFSFAGIISRGDEADCHDATCRISAGNARGTGCVFEISRGHVFVLTNAHVVGNASTVECEFWRHGHQSRPVRGEVIMRSGSVDAAVIALAEAAFGGTLPAAVPFADRDTALRPGETVISVGCPHGGWATAWRGHVLGYRGADLHFVPTPANGRSGSAVFDAAGRRIVALLRARTMDERQGIAVSVQSLYRAFSSEAESGELKAESGKLKAESGGWRAQRGENGTQCPGGLCPGGGCLPFRRPSQPDRQGDNHPWPTLPPQVPAPGAVVDLAPLEDKLDGINSRLDRVIDNTARLGGLVPSAPAERPEPKVPEAVTRIGQKIDALAETAASGIAEAKHLAAKAQEGVDRLEGAVNTLADNQARLTEAVGENGTLAQRFHARVDRVRAELGEDAGKLETSVAYLKDMLKEKALHPISAMKLGLATGSPVAIGLLALGLIVVFKDVRDRIKTGDRLMIEKLAGRIADVTPWQADDRIVEALSRRIDAVAERMRPAPPEKAARND